MMRKVLFVFIMISLAFSVSDYFFSMRSSYKKYESGEYFFRYKATTILAEDPEAWMSNIEAFEEAAARDYSDPKTMLLYGVEDTVWACDPHDGICTVVFDHAVVDELPAKGVKTETYVIDDFPVSNLRFENDDKAYFDGTKKFSFQEYIKYVSGLSDYQLASYHVSDKKMARFTSAKESLIILAAVDLGIVFLLFIFYKSELDTLFDITLVLGALYGVLFEVITMYTR